MLSEKSDVPDDIKAAIIRAYSSGTPPKQPELKPYRTVGPFLVRNYMYYEKVICPVEPMPTPSGLAYAIEGSLTDAESDQKDPPLKKNTELPML